MPPGPPASDPLQSLFEADHAFSRHSRKHGAAAAFEAFLHPQARQLPAGSHPLSGRDAIVRQLRGGDDRFSLVWQPLEGDVAASGDLGWTWGTYVLTWREPSGRPHFQHGKYLNIWRREQDGPWRVVVDVGNTSPGPLPEGG
ncbi:MAG: YybH family protein [Opitutales bacterium]